MIEMRDPLKTEDLFFFFVKCRSKNNITSSVIENGKNSTRFDLLTTNDGC